MWWSVPNCPAPSPLAERIEDLQRPAVEHHDLGLAPVADVQEPLPGSAENAVLAAVVPLPHSGALHSRPMNTCVTYLPSSVNTCTRLPPRSETYTRPSFDTRAACTGWTNCGAPCSSASGSAGLGGGVGRHVAEGAPHPLERAGVGVEHDHAPVAVAVGDEELVRLRVHERVRRLVEVLRVGVALALPGTADLHDELPGLRELEDLMVLVRRCRRSRRSPSGRRRRRAPSWATRIPGPARPMPG